MEIMERMITPELESVSKTLLLPLWGRAQASRMKQPVISDRRAVELIDRMNYDFTPLFKNLGMFHALTLAVRAREFDRKLLDFVRRRGSATVVNIGAGLDTAFSRVRGEGIRWIDVDMPHVIELRKQLIPETSGMDEIPKSMLDESFFADIGPAENVLLLVAGVFMYFEQAQVRRFLESAAKHLPGAEIVFDALSPMGIRYYNRKLKKSGFQDASMKWGIRDPRQLERWNLRLKLHGHQRYYANVRSGPMLPLPVRAKMMTADALRLGHIVHLRVDDGENV